MSKLLLALATAVSLGGCSAQAETVEGGRQAYRQNKVAEAERIFTAVARDPGVAADDHATAERELARIAWLVDRDATRANARLEAAMRTGAQPCDTSQVLARVLAESDQAGILIARAPELAATCPEAREADIIRLHLLRARLDAAAGDPSQLQPAQAVWAALSREVQDSPEGSRARLGLALLGSDAAEALSAWRRFFWLAEAAAPPAIASAVSDASQILQAGTAPRAATGSRLALVELLIRAGFGPEARQFAARHDLQTAADGSPAWRKAVAYWTFRDRVKAMTLAAYRRTARGGKQPGLEAEMEGATTALMSSAGLSGDPGVALLQAYGLYGTVGNTGGYPSVHLGHAIEDRRETITQYGETAKVRLLVIENMLSNGFESWLWDGFAEAGGWTAAGPVIVQVRSGYTGGPMSLWRLFSDPMERRRVLDAQAGLARADAAKLTTTDVAYLRGLNGRLRLQVADQIGARAKAKGGDLREAFLSEAWRASLDHSIFVHEGRHALDKRLIRGLARFDDTNLEYRAKLSELALAAYPRLALYNMNEPGLGGNTPHSKANAKVLKAYAVWIRDNPALRPGAGAQPASLAQLDSLNDDQIRSVARSLDPLARKGR